MHKRLPYRLFDREDYEHAVALFADAHRLDVIDKVLEWNKANGKMPNDWYSFAELMKRDRSTLQKTSWGWKHVHILRTCCYLYLKVDDLYPDLHTWLCNVAKYLEPQTPCVEIDEDIRVFLEFSRVQSDRRRDNRGQAS